MNQAKSEKLFFTVSTVFMLMNSLISFGGFALGIEEDSFEPEQGPPSNKKRGNPKNVTYLIHKVRSVSIDLKIGNIQNKKGL